MDYILDNFNYEKYIDISNLKSYYGENNDKITLFYELIKTKASNDYSTLYYCDWMISKLKKYNSDSELQIEINNILAKYPDRVEAPYDLSYFFNDKLNKINLLWKLYQVNIPNNHMTMKYINKNLYNWKILDDLVIDCYYNGMYKESYDAWNILMNKKDVEYPNQQIKNQCVDNGRFAKIVIDSKNSYNIFKDDIDKINYNQQQTDQDYIPKIFHYIYIEGGYDFTMSHCISILSCYEVNKPDKIYLYSNTDLKNNKWWNLIKNYVQLVIVKIPEYINNCSVIFKQHQADIMRLYILKKAGGIYMDLDVMCLHPLDGTQVKPLIETEGSTNLYENNFVITRESPNKLCNCFIMTKKNNQLIDIWLKCYETSYGDSKHDYWAGLSVITPNKLINDYNLKVTILKAKSIFPFMYNDHSFFKQDITDSLKESLTIHLWDTEAFKYNLIPTDISYFQNNNNTYTKLFSKYLNIIEQK